MSGNSSFVYWDSGVFISWLSGEDTPENLDGIKYFQEQHALGGIVVVTSTITRIEVRSSYLPEKARQTFVAFLNRQGDVSLVSAHRKIADLAHDLVEWYAERDRQDRLGKLSVPDAIHLATAIRSDCGLFLTFDGQRGDRKKKDRRLLTLTQPIAGQYNLPIEAPVRPPPGPDTGPRQLVLSDLLPGDPTKR